MGEKRKWTPEEVQQWYTGRKTRNYYNPEDSNWIVRKPGGVGWNMNLTNPRTWVFLGVVLAIVLLLVFGLNQSKPTTIVGTWKTTVSVLGADAASGETGELRYEFREDGTGQDTAIARGREIATDFTYTFDGGNLTISYPDGRTLTFSAALSGSKLTLRVDNQESVFERVN